MKEYENYLKNNSHSTHYIDSYDKASDIRNFIKDISGKIDKIHFL